MFTQELQKQDTQFSPQSLRWTGIPTDSFLQVLQTCNPFLSCNPPVEKALSAEEHSHKATRSTTVARRRRMKDTRRECFWHTSDNLPATPHPSISFNLLFSPFSLTFTVSLHRSLSVSHSASRWPVCLFVSLSTPIISSIFALCQAHSAHALGLMCFPWYWQVYE